MRYLFLILLIAAIGSGLWYHNTLEEKYRHDLQSEEKPYRETLAELNKHKTLLEKELDEHRQAARAERKAMAGMSGPAEAQAPAEEALDLLNQQDSAVKKNLKSKAGLMQRSKALQAQLDGARERLDLFKERVDNKVEENFQTMEARRTQAYRDFERRMAADKTKLADGKGPRYAREKKQLDAKAAAYQDQVNEANDKLRELVTQKEDEFEQLEAKILVQIGSIERVLNDPDFSPDSVADLDSDPEPAAQVAAKPAVADELPEAPANEIDKLIKEELKDVERQIAQLKGEHNEDLKAISEKHAKSVDDLKLYGGVTAFLLGLLTLAGFHFSRHA